MSKHNGHNDIERQEWVNNDEGLYNAQRHSRQPMRTWIRDNRAMIDEVIDNVVNGKKPAHYLAYPTSATHN